MLSVSNSFKSLASSKGRQCFNFVVQTEVIIQYTVTTATTIICVIIIIIIITITEHTLRELHNNYINVAQRSH